MQAEDHTVMLDGSELTRQVEMPSQLGRDTSMHTTTLHSTLVNIFQKSAVLASHGAATATQIRAP